jgi:DNA-directed RNA polymerase sigma subunit (sigma70/sigma32)
VVDIEEPMDLVENIEEETASLVSVFSGIKSCKSKKDDTKCVTQEDGMLSLYLDEIDAIPLLTVNEEKEITIRAVKEDEYAKNRLIE